MIWTALAYIGYHGYNMGYNIAYNQRLNIGLNIAYNMRYNIGLNIAYNIDAHKKNPPGRKSLRGICHGIVRYTINQEIHTYGCQAYKSKEGR